jgi:hypothetical protein
MRGLASTPPRLDLAELTVSVPGPQLGLDLQLGLHPQLSLGLQGFII